MPASEISGPEQPDPSIGVRLWNKRAEMLWGLVAAIMLLTFVNPVVLIGAALLIATVAVLAANQRSHAGDDLFEQRGRDLQLERDLRTARGLYELRLRRRGVRRWSPPLRPDAATKRHRMCRL